MASMPLYRGAVLFCGMRPDPIPALKRELARELLARVADIPSFAAAELLGIDRARFCDLRRGREDRLPSGS